MKNINTFTVGKWKIELNSNEVAPDVINYYVKVDNLNAKVLWKVTKYHYNFGNHKERAEEWIMNFVNSQKEWEQTKIKRREARKIDKSTDITTVVKRALVNKYGYKNVRVFRGTGTAWGWVHANVVVDKKAPYENCEACKISTYGRCYSCKNKVQDLTNEAKMIAYAAIEEAGLKFYTYSSDDGYGSDHDEFMLDINYVK